MEVNVIFIGVAVADFEAAVDWYERFWGRPPDIPINDDEVMWQAVESGWLYLIRDSTGAGTAIVTLAVPDLDASIAELDTRGVRPGAIETVGNAGRKALVVDPEGNTIALAEVARGTEDSLP